MSKLNVCIGDMNGGQHYYSIKDQMHYLFFSKSYEEKHLTGDAVKHLMEKTHGHIKNSKGQDFYFDRFELKSNRHKQKDGHYTNVEISGYAFRTHVDMISYHNNWPFKELEDILTEPGMERLDWFTVILIRIKGEGVFGRENDGYGKNEEHSGYIDLQMEYEIRKRHKYIKDEHRTNYKNREWEYYKLHDKNINLVPHEQDRVHIDEDDYVAIIPYTPEAHEALKRICEAGNKLGKELHNLFSTGKFLKHVSLQLTFTTQKNKEPKHGTKKRQ